MRTTSKTTTSSRMKKMSSSVARGSTARSTTTIVNSPGPKTAILIVPTAGAPMTTPEDEALIAELDAKAWASTRYGRASIKKREDHVCYRAARRLQTLTSQAPPRGLTDEDVER